MLTLDARPESVRLRTVRLRGAADGLAARRRLESALSDIAPSALGLPDRSLLVVKRVAPAARLRLASDRGAEFRRAVHADLEHSIAHARRPWLHADAAAAAAVLFADESELIACLVRDWLRGLLAERWWWPALSRGLPLSLWWRRSVLPRGDVLPAVLAHLAPHGDAVAWLLHLSDDEVAEAIAAVTAAHALAALSATAPSAPPAATLAHHPPGSASVSPPQTAGVQRLLALIPELQTSGLTGARLRLLGLALALQHAPGWVRSAEFAAALRSLEAAAALRSPEAAAAAAAGTGAAGAPPAPRIARAAVFVETSAVVATPATVFVTDAPAADPADLPKRIDVGARAVAPVPSVLPVPWTPPVAAPRFKPAPMATTASTQRAITPVSGTAAALPPVRAPRPTAPLHVTETQFGGLFYLLNLALALELYGDFTQPRGENLALSPWDRLALVGRAWFGCAFKRDPIWELLAALAGRPPDQSPGCDFTPPETWLVPADWLRPWGTVSKLDVYCIGGRLQVRHRAGFAVLDVPLAAADKPMLRARELCAQHAGLAGARLLRGRKPRRAPVMREGGALGRWMSWLLPYVQERLARALGTRARTGIARQVCRHPARLICTATALDVHLSLANLPLAVRIAGLDRDPGSIPAAGRTVAFHFD